MTTAQTQPAQGATPSYGLMRTVDMPYEQAVERITATLKEQGFGILTEIDVKKTLKEKLNQDFTKYVILGACNPPLAHRALSAEMDIGLLLPCNVTVYEDATSGKTVVSAIDPDMLVTVTGKEALKPIAQEVSQKLRAALDAL